MINSESIEEEIENKEERVSFFLKWIAYKGTKVRITVLILLVIATIFGCFALGYFCFYKWLPDFWDWGFGLDGTVWKGIVTVFGAIYLVIIPFIPILISSGYIENIIKMFADDAEKEFNLKLETISRQQGSYEEKLEGNDNLGLIPLVTYSRLELEQYYKIGLTQTQKSYTYSILAMWIGLIVIISGIVLYFMPIGIVNDNYVSGNIQILVISSGIFTEFISALFLWIYKSSVNNLTYFYNRQIFIHNTLLAFKISTSMKDGDDAKKIIIEKILDFGFKNHHNVFEKISNKNTSR